MISHVAEGRSPSRATQLAFIRPKVFTRRNAIERLGARLTQSGYPRLGLLLSMSFAGCVGFLSSAGLLALGIHAPAIRYVLALGIGYGVLLLLLRLWLLQRHDDGQFDLHIDVPGGESFDLVSSQFGGGGGFSGGGSSASFSSTDTATSSSGGGNSILEVAGDADEGVVVIGAVLLVIAVLVGLGATFSVVLNAPALLGEVVLDGAIATAAYRRMRLASTQHWTQGVFKRTWKPLVSILVALLILGIAIPLLVPGGDSIGDLFR